MSQLEDIKARTEGHSPTPWQHQPWGGQNQNGDYSGGDVFDANGERVVAEVMDADGALIEAAPKLLAALEAVEALHESGHVYSLTDDGVVGDDGTILATFCTACTPEQTLEAIGDCEWTEDFETVQHPCPTITAITEALA